MHFNKDFNILDPYLSRTEWAIRALRLKKESQPFENPGVVLIQVDGFALTQLERALERRRMPFVRTLINSGKYKMYTFYSGLPSVTPAVQGEIMYGVKTAVPAFNYFDRTTRQIKTMYERESASFVEEYLKKFNDGLLKGGSSYSNIYTGGSTEPHFCAADWGISGFFHAVNPFLFPVFFICYIDIFVWTIVLVVIELFLSIYECIKGTLSGWNFLKELEYIWVRVLACILLREVVTVGTCMDIKRGLPIIHLNLIGYDEQAHRRGPSSWYAHWTLLGIDDCIKRIFKIAKRVEREYQIIIFSDHGQQRTIPYPKLHKETLRETISKILKEKNIPINSIPPSELKHEEEPEFEWTWREHNFLKHAFKKTSKIMPEELIVTDMGPEAHVYFPKRLSPVVIEEIIEKIIRETKIPLGMIALEDQKIMAWTKKGKFILPDQIAAVIGADHPFVKDIGHDLLNIIHHPDAGDIVFSGWCQGEQAITFPLENGSHGGMGIDETRGFALLPAKLSFIKTDKNYMRPRDLHETVFSIIKNHTKENS